jgi:hypothetical protein
MVPVPRILVPVPYFWFRQFGSVYLPPSDMGGWTVIKNANHYKTCNINIFILGHIGQSKI